MKNAAGVKRGGVGRWRVRYFSGGIGIAPGNT
jgi:hypothetical protein